MPLTPNPPTQQHKITAAQVANPSVDDKAAMDVAARGCRIREQLKIARDYEAKARKKAGVELRKAENNWITVTQLLAEAKAKCSAGGFKKFKAKYCPDLGRSRIYELLAIASGKKSIEQVKAESRGRKAKERAENKRELSVTTIVTDEPAVEPLPVAVGKSAEVEVADPEVTAEPAPITEPEAPPPPPNLPAPIEVVAIEPVGAELGSIVESDWSAAERAFEALTAHPVAQVVQAIPPGRVALVTKIADYFADLAANLTAAPAAGSDYSIPEDGSIPRFLQRGAA